MKKWIACLLALSVVFLLALQAAAFPVNEADSDEDSAFGIAPGYVRTKESYKDGDGSTHTYTRAYNKQGKPVKEVETIKDGKDSRTYMTKWAYDKKGNLTKQVFYTDDAVMTDTYTLNKAGRVTKQVRKIAYEDQSIDTSSRAYTYDKAGHVVKERAFYDDCEETVTRVYDKAGRLTKEACTQAYEDNTRTVTVTAYTYDKKGNEIKMAYTQKDRYGAVEKRTIVSVPDAKNLCVKKTENWSYASGDSVDKTRSVTTYAYDKKGKVTKEVFQSVSSDGYNRKDTTASTYDANGNCIKRVIVEKAPGYSSKATTAYTYDKKGNLLKEVTVMKNGTETTKTTETYTYDKAGNLLKYVFVSPSGRGVTCYTYQKIGA